MRDFDMTGTPGMLISRLNWITGKMILTFILQMKRGLFDAA
jgi:hypothetical protein